ncbi:penicillin acylase family protein [Endozoicomonas arenosclerae]|uniref:penicillin acylase family protein n=1 Tax=Endozoicomonas arenosclerae TaxID=1633495 RepID=UPI000783AADF|nr:penicillin acylase family protein [Endozoicomonas arenosclerae]
MAVWLRRGLLLSLCLLILIALSLYVLLQQSLPLLNGEQSVQGIQSKVLIERDDLGIPTISGEQRTDIASALGYVHGQERFFQMDLNRRNSAGELSELVGELALKHDKNQRKHRFRKTAEQAVIRMEPTQRAILDAYTQGVNQGLQSLDSKPFEYWLLNVEPVLWGNEDTFLTVFSMYMDLNDDEVKLDNAKGFLSRVTSKEVIDFLSPLRTRWDSPMEPGSYPVPATPGSDQVNLREKTPEFFSALTGELIEDALIGSNNWAVSGEMTSHGGAMVEDDMHLSHRVPTIWYRAQFRYSHSETGEPVSITGVTLPGAPIIVVGSNGKVAWGFTNSTADWVDLVELELGENDLYMTPEGPEHLTIWNETIQVKGQEPVVVEYRGTRWGPVIESPYDSAQYALRWTAHDPEATNINLMNLETVDSVHEAMAVANTSGIPPQNFTVGDAAGNIGWTIAGRIPTRSGLDSTYPLPWQDADSHWRAWLPTVDYPRILNPENNRIWTANARVVSGENYKKLGNGGYALGPRQMQIRDDLMAIETADEKSLLNVALDDRALYQENLRQIVLNVLDEPVRSEKQGRQAFYQFVEGWSGRASTEDVGYRLVREFHDALKLKVVKFLGRYFMSKAEDAKADIEDSWLQKINHENEMLLRLYQEQPMNWLSSQYDSWDELFLETIDDVIVDLGGVDKLSEATWGQRNTAKINHPLSDAIPVLGQFLNMPAVPLEGDIWMPRAQRPSGGVSERMIVAPGHEETAIFHMPGGQSGHPLSPFYKAGYMDWVEARETPFLPGDTQYQLTLIPAQ